MRDEANASTDTPPRGPMSSDLDERIAQLRRVYRPAPVDGARFERGLRRRRRLRRLRGASATALMALGVAAATVWWQGRVDPLADAPAGEVARAVAPTFEAVPAYDVAEPLDAAQDVAVARAAVDDRFAAAALRTGLDYGDLPPGYGVLYGVVAPTHERGNP